MEKQQKKRIKKYISWILLVAMVVLLAAMPLLASEQQLAEGPQASILTGTVGRGNISTTLVGGGTLSADDVQALTVPAAVKLTGYQVRNGDLVREGDVIAKVDRVTVMTAISQVQQTLEEISDELEDIRDQRQSEQVKAIAEATVKVVYGKEGENVQDVMIRDGALAALSLDGLMAVRIRQDTSLSGGDSVAVKFSDGTQVDGRVESNLDGELVVTLRDEDYMPGETVTVFTADAEEIGSGSLYIHSQWNAVAYSGRIKAVRVDVGDSVNAGRTLFTLEDTGRTGEFEMLSGLHREYEELMLTLFTMYQTETVTAPCDGVVSGVDENGTFMLASVGQWNVTLLANSPNGDDESSYVNFVGQVWGVGIDGLVMKMNPQPLNIPDYKELGDVPVDPALMTEDVVYTAEAPVYELIDGEWVQVDPATVIPGDVLLFAGDAQGSFVWVVRIARGEDAPQEPEETEPTEATEPEESVPEATEPEPPAQTEPPEAPTEPSVPEIPTVPDDSEGTTEPTLPDFGNTQFPQFNIGGFGNFAGGYGQEQADDRYSLETVTVATVTPQEKMQLHITIDELDISGITLGQQAQITLDALMGQHFTATVTEIAGTGINAGGNSKFTVTLLLDKAENMLPGMTASAVITLDTTENVLCVPAEALAEVGSRTVLYRSYDPETETFLDPVPVTTGASDGELVQILSGAEEGMAFTYAYYNTLAISATPDKSLIPVG